MVRITNNLSQGSNRFEREFICDTEADVATIDISVLVMGSGVYVIDTGNTYILNSRREWKAM